MRQLIERRNEGFGRFFPCDAVNALYFPHTCDLWKPGPLALGASKVAQDVVYVMAATGQACMYLATPEVDEATMVGRNKEVNIFTLDHFVFPQGVAIEDTWVIKLTSVAVQDLYGRFWSVQGNAEVVEGIPFHPVQSQVVYAKLSQPPKGVS